MSVPFSLVGVSCELQTENSVSITAVDTPDCYAASYNFPIVLLYCFAASKV